MPIIDGKQFSETTCVECGKVFLARNMHKKYCSKICKIRYWEKHRTVQSKQTKYDNRKKRWKQYYLDNREKVLARNKPSVEKMQKRNRKFIRNLKQDYCADCKQYFPFYVMDFDHRDPSKKEYLISDMLGHSLKSILKEVEKCDLLCSNCHRIRHHKKKFTDNYYQSHIVALEEECDIL